MIVALDVDYRADAVVAAAVGFENWSDAAPSFEKTQRFPPNAEAYEPGAFYKREMPYLEALLASLPSYDVIVIDGYVWLDAGRAGLGAHLHDTLGGVTPVVGVAKRPFHGASRAVSVLRGTSATPLFVTAAGLSQGEAARRIAEMHGPHRVPTLLRRVDRLSRE